MKDRVKGSQRFMAVLTFLALLIAPVLSVMATHVKSEKREVRQITPPQLGNSHLDIDLQNNTGGIVCHRPMRHGCPRLKLKEMGGIYPKTVVHNYGAGGSGWTLGPGFAHEAVDRLEKHFSGQEAALRSREITVLGAGVIGLFTAWELTQRNYTNITVKADQFGDLTSHRAGGLLAPVSMDNDKKYQGLMDRVGRTAYIFYDEIAKKKDLFFSTGAVIVPAYFSNREESGLEPYVKMGIMKPAKDVTLDFGNGTTRDMVVYEDGIFIDTWDMMTQLRHQLEARGVKFEELKERVKCLSDIPDPIVFNCTGLGAKELVQDEKMASVQGHLIMLKDQVPTNLQYMLLIYLREVQVGDFKAKLSFYIFPKRSAGSSENDIGVIGGSFIEGATDETPNREVFGMVIEEARKFYGLIEASQ